MLLFLALISDEEDKSKFEKLYIDKLGLLLNIANGITKNQADAEDAVYESFYKLAEYFDKYSSKSIDELTALLVTMVKHKSIDILRKNKRISEYDAETIILYNDRIDIMPEESLIQEESKEYVKEILHQLPESLYEVLDLKYYQELSNGEIAKLLGLKIKTVEMRVYRAKEKIKEILNEVQ